MKTRRRGECEGKLKKKAHRIRKKNKGKEEHISSQSN